MLAFLAAALLSPLPFSVVALALLLFQVYLTYKPVRAPLGLVAILACLIILPLVLEPILSHFAAFLVLPAIPLLGFSLKENVPCQGFAPTTKERCATITLKSLLTALIIVLITSILMANWTLTATSTLLFLYLIGICIYIVRSIPKTPLETSQTWVRIIAGDTGQALVSLKSKAKLSLHVSLSSCYPWLHLIPSRFVLTPKNVVASPFAFRHSEPFASCHSRESGNLAQETTLNLSLTPPLAGPSQPPLEALFLDPWGLTQTRQIVKPVDLYVIPRARYAEWLARKYLEETAPGAGAIAQTISATQASMGLKRGVEYYDSRPYQPGDRIKDIDWRHTMKLQELIVKEHVEDSRQSAILAVNLAAGDAEEADKLIYNLITSALTLARETIPTALAAYNEKQVIMETPPLDPRETVKKAMELGQRVIVNQPMGRYLAPPDIRGIKTSLRRLEKASAEPAQKLREILELEEKAIEEGAKRHPSAKALLHVAAHTLPPATITVISAWNHDSEALSVTLLDLRKRGYNTMVMRVS